MRNCIEICVRKHILSTSQGIVTDREARQKQIGGEIICYVW